MKLSLYKLLLVNDHVIAKVIKAQLIVGHIGDIAVIGCPALIVGVAVQHHAYGQTQSLMDLAHPLRVTVRQIVIDGYDMDALSFQCIQIGRKGGYQCFSFTGLHLGNAALMKNDSADQLNPVMLHPKNTPCGFPHGSKRFYQYIIQRLSFCQTLFELLCLPSKLLIGQFHHSGS